MEESPQAAALTSRFVAGRRIEDALGVTRRLNRQGISTTLAYLGESVTTLEEAQAARDVALDLLGHIQDQRLQANLSVKLTQLGIDVAEAACRENAAALAEKARGAGNFIRIDMESSAYTARTLALVEDLHAAYGNVGAVIQAYLHRSAQDVEDLIGRGVGVRLCKGAYAESPEAAFARKSEVDACFAKLARRLLDAGNNPALASHDEKLLREAIAFAERQGVSKANYEIQMLYGIRRGLQAKLVAQGHRLRVYVPFGMAWYPYFMRRLAERPANAYFVARNLFRR